jgi:hypothetical protein
MKTKLHLLILIACLMVVGSLTAQTKTTETASEEKSPVAAAEKHYYRLEYVLRELDGTREVSKRTYVVSARSDGSYGQLRAGTRIPIATGVTSGATTNTQFQYIDVGVNIDTRVQQDANGVWIFSGAEISSTAPTEAGTTPAAGPMIRQAKNNSIVPFTAGKSILVFSADDPTSTHRFELSVTATQLK